MGDHTDYNDGFVLPLALDRACTVTTVARDGRSVVATSDEVAGQVEVAVDGSVDPRGVEPPWGRFVAGVVGALVDAGATVAPSELTISSTVPVGSGLSSSSALSVAVTLALADGAGATLERHPGGTPGIGRRNRGHRSARRAHGPARVAVRPGWPRAARRLPFRCGHTDRHPAVDRGARRALRGGPHPRRLRVRARAAPSAKPSQPSSGSPRCATRPPSRCATVSRRATSSARTRAFSRPRPSFPPATCPCWARSCSRATPACATTSSVSTPELDMLVDDPGGRAARPAPVSPAPGSVGVSSPSRSATTPTTCWRRRRSATGPPPGSRPTGFVARAVDGARRVD